MRSPASSENSSSNQILTTVLLCIGTPLSGWPGVVTEPKGQKLTGTLWRGVKTVWMGVVGGALASLPCGRALDVPRLVATVGRGKRHTPSAINRGAGLG